MDGHRKDKNLRQAERYLPDNFITALDPNFERADGSTNHRRGVKGALRRFRKPSADRAPRARHVRKAPEVQYHHEGL